MHFNENIKANQVLCAGIAVYAWVSLRPDTSSHEGEKDIVEVKKGLTKCCILHYLENNLGLASFGP